MKTIVYILANKVTSFLIVFFFANTFCLYSQIPQAFRYQAVVRETDGSIIANKTIGLQISILQGSTDGNLVFKETHTITTSNLGVAALHIGTGNSVSGNFQSIDWSQGNYFVKIEVDKSGGNNFVLLGSSKLQSVPFALFANKANIVNLISGTGILINGNTITNTTPDQTLILTGTGTVSVSGTYPNYTIIGADNQMLSLVNDKLTLSGGNTVLLPYIRKSDNCEQSTVGHLRLNKQTKKMEFCNGFVWVEMNTGQLPIVVTDSISNINAYSAKCYGKVQQENGSSVLESGFCYSTTPLPTIEGKYIAVAYGTGLFSQIITELLPNSTYYIRSYAINSIGISYGNQISITTLGE